MERSNLYIAKIFIAENGIDDDDATAFKTYDVCCEIVRMLRNGTFDGDTPEDEYLKFKYYHGQKPSRQLFRLNDLLNRQGLKNDMQSFVEFFGRPGIYDCETDQLYSE